MCVCRKSIINFIICAMLIFSFTSIVNGQKITISGIEFRVGGNRIWMNGANTPWNSWNDFGGSFDYDWWNNHFQELVDNGINSSRIWISCNGDVAPDINSSGYVTGVSQAFWDDCDQLFQIAQDKGIYIMACMISFDHFKSANATGWRNMVASEATIQSFIDVYLMPFVLRYESNPYFFSVDLCNEIEWVHENVECGQLPWIDLQRYIAMCAAAIHQNSDVLVTNGSACIKWGSDLYEGNFWSDAALQAAYNSPDAYLDYYHVHYYEWVYQWFGSPFDRSPADYQINDRPVVVGECPAQDMPEIPITIIQAYENAFSLGYQGVYPWTSNGVDANGDLTTLGPATTSFMNNHYELVYPPIGMAPTVSITSPTSGATFTEGDDITILADASDGDGTITKVEFYNGDTKLGEDTTSPYSYTLSNASAGNYLLKARATDNDGNKKTSTAVDITVNPYGPGIDDLANGEILVSGTVTGNFNDTHNSDNSYEVIREGESGGKPSNRYSYLEHKWTFNVSGGDIVTLYVEAYHSLNGEGDDFVFAYSLNDVNYTDIITVTKTVDDNTYQSYILPAGTSGTVYIRVKDLDQTSGNRNLDDINVDHMFIRSRGGSGNIPPSVSITSPLDGAAFTEGDDVIIEADASDSDGSVIKVEFFEGSNKLGEDASSPYSFTWFNVPLGSYTLTAKAIDDGDASTISDPVNITVNPVGSTQMHIFDIAMATQKTGANVKAIATVTIVDANNNPVEGATVSGQWSGLTSDSDQGITDSNGAVSLESDVLKKPVGTFTFTVNNVTKSGWIYDSDSNVMTSNSISYGLGKQVAQNVPTEFCLSNNYPNPFNPETEIRYQLPEAAKVLFEIYDTIGQKVCTLVDEEQSAGTYSTRWNATNEYGQRVTSGIYIYRIKVKGATTVLSNSRKMILLK